MPRYEFVEGTSNKFWEIKLEGSSFSTTYGKIGTAGATTQKSWDSEEKAKKEYDKLIAEKVKKGYLLVGGGAKAAPKPSVVKAAAPKAAAPIAAKKAAAPAGDWLRYEFVEGTSNKFWEIKLAGLSFQTKYGKIGTDGTITEKGWDSEEKAKKEYDKLIAEKVKKGYLKV